MRYLKHIIYIIRDWLQLQKQKYIYKQCKHCCGFCKYKEECLSTGWYKK